MVSHATFLRSQGAEYRAAARALAVANVIDAELSEADQTLMTYAAKLTQDPSTIDDEDVANLQRVGFDDAQIWEATFTASIFALFNRMADAYGIQPSGQMLTAFQRI